MDIPVAEIPLKRGTSGLGFNIRGGVDNPHIQGDCGIFVAKVRDDGAAGKDGRLQQGDKVLSVNGIDLARVTHQEAVSCFVNAGEEVNLKVQHGAEAAIMKRLEDSIKKQQKKGGNQGNTSGSSWKLPVLLIALGLAGAGAFVIWRQRMR